jgi:beta-phosphoglucomutase-like phosphatase (HAD superfamily)
VVAFVVDLDGTLVHSVDQHVLAWREALDRDGIGRHPTPAGAGLRIGLRRPL